MAQDIPESKPVVQLPVATHSSIYSHNLTKKDYWINCQAGGLGFYTLLDRNPITLISVGSTSQKIMPAFQIDIGHDYEYWSNMLLSMCRDSKFHGFRDCVNMYGTDYKSTVLRVYRSKPWAVSVKHSEREFR